MKFSIITSAFTCTIITGGASATKPQRKRTSTNNRISVDTMKEEPYGPFLGLRSDATNEIIESGGRWRMLQEGTEEPTEEEKEGTEEPTEQEEGTEEPTAEEKIPTYAPTAGEKIPTYAPTAGEKIPTYAPTAGDGTDAPVVTEAPVKEEVEATTTMATTIAEEVEEATTTMATTTAEEEEEATTTMATTIAEEEEEEVIETDMSFPEEESDKGVIAGAESESVINGSSRALYVAPLVAVVVKTVSIAIGFFMMA